MSERDTTALMQEAKGHLADYGEKIAEILRALGETCPLCDHEWLRHDPEDGMCDAHSSENGVLGPCRCGREIEFQQAANARLSKAALDAVRPSG